jgi:hypothetical protein
MFPHQVQRSVSWLAIEVLADRSKNHDTKAVERLAGTQPLNKHPTFIQVAKPAVVALQRQQELSCFAVNDLTWQLRVLCQVVANVCILMRPKLLINGASSHSGRRNTDI